jgi:ubiquitin C-terminal hydrolase
VTLNLNITDKNLSIVDMIKQLYNEDINCDVWECEKCKLKTKYIKQTKLWSIPKVLFIVVTRFADMFRKNTEPININEQLHFNEGTELSNPDVKKYYKLSSMALHVGNLNSGHYMAICNNDTDNYLLYNDMDIKEINNFKNNNNSAYMIIYNQV